MGHMCVERIKNEVISILMFQLNAPSRKTNNYQITHTIQKKETLSIGILDVCHKSNYKHDNNNLVGHFTHAELH